MMMKEVNLGKPNTPLNSYLYVWEHMAITFKNIILVHILMLFVWAWNHFLPCGEGEGDFKPIFGAIDVDNNGVEWNGLFSWGGLKAIKPMWIIFSTTRTNQTTARWMGHQERDF